MDSHADDFLWPHCKQGQLVRLWFNNIKNALPPLVYRTNDMTFILGTFCSL